LVRVEISKKMLLLLGTFEKPSEQPASVGTERPPQVKRVTWGMK